MDDQIGLKIGLALFGGALIALSSSLNYLFFGKITGLSGYLYYVVGFKFGPLFHLRLCFIVGMITVVDIYYNTAGSELLGLAILDPEEEINLVSWIIGGLLIGFGVRWSGGCTTGHGVCGLPRLSKRALTAVCIFMIFGIATASINAVIGPLPPSFKFEKESKFYYNIVPRIVLSCYQFAALVFIVYFLVTKRAKVQKFSPLAYFFTGTICGLGFLISGMCRRQKILHFLALNSEWDPSLMFVMGSAAGINLLTFQYTIRKKEAFFNKDIDLPDSYMDKGIYIGPALFGVGWGIIGLCPGPALANITVLGWSLSVVILIFIGQYMFDYCERQYYKRLEDHKAEAKEEDNDGSNKVITVQAKYEVDMKEEDNGEVNNDTVVNFTGAHNDSITQFTGLQIDPVKL